MRFEVGIDPQTLPYGFQNEIMYHPCSTGVPKAIGSDVPNLMKDVPNFVKNVPNFVNDAPRVPNCVMRWNRPQITFLWVSK